MALVFEVGDIPLAPQFIAALSEVLTRQFSLDPATYTIEVSDLSIPAMQQLNGERRGKPEATDVLSFPLFPDLVSLKQQQTAEVPVGNLITCSSYAREQGTALEELILHGSLHLMGFDHETDLATWSEAEQASRAALTEMGFSLTGIEKGYL